MMCRRKNPEDTNLQQGLEQAEAKMNVGGYTHAAAPGKAIGEPQPEPEPSALSVGGKVTVQGLKGAPQHNGKEGVIQSFEQAKGRYVVALGDGTQVSLKQDNVQQQVEGCEVLGIQSKPELNGQIGTVLDFDAAKERCHVRLGGKTASLAAANIILPDVRPTLAIKTWLW